MPEVARCRNNRVHFRSDGVGNILFVMEGNSIYAKCTDRGCKRWTRMEISLPGVNIDFSNAALIQSLMPKNFKFDIVDKDIKRAPVIIKGEA